MSTKLKSRSDGTDVSSEAGLLAISAPTADTWQSLYNLYWVLAVAAGTITIGSLVFFVTKFRARPGSGPAQHVLVELQLYKRLRCSRYIDRAPQQNCDSEHYLDRCVSFVRHPGPSSKGRRDPGQIQPDMVPSIHHRDIPDLMLRIVWGWARFHESKARGHLGVGMREYCMAEEVVVYNQP